MGRYIVAYALRLTVEDRDLALVARDVSAVSDRPHANSGLFKSSCAAVFRQLIDDGFKAHKRNSIGYLLNSVNG